MAEYIEREALSEYFREKFEYYKAESEIKMRGGYVYDEKMQYAAIVAKHFLDELKRTPAADVVEVVHGHNKTSMHPVDEFLCSVCGFCCADYTETKYDEDGDYEYSCECEFDYCPKCGAKMDGKGG